MPPFFRDLRSDQAGHLFAYVHNGPNKGFSLRDLGFFYPTNFDVSGQPLTRKKAWGRGYSGDYVYIKAGKKDESGQNMTTLFPRGGTKPSHVDTLPPTFTSCWRRMPTMPASMTFSVETTASASSSSSASAQPYKKRKIEVDLDADLAETLSKLEGIEGKAAGRLALMQLVFRLKFEKAELETKISNIEAGIEGRLTVMKYEVLRAKKASDRAAHFERVLERVQKSRDFYKQALGDVLNENEVAQEILTASISKTDRDLNGIDDWLDVDDSEFDYEGVPVGPVRDSYAALNRRTDFIESTLTDELEEKFITERAFQGLQRYKKDDVIVNPTRKTPAVVVDDESSSEDEDNAKGGVAVQPRSELERELAEVKEKRADDRREVKKLRDAIANIGKTLASTNLLGNGSGTGATASKTVGKQAATQLFTADRKIGGKEDSEDEKEEIGVEDTVDPLTEDVIDLDDEMDTDSDGEGFP